MSEETKLVFASKFGLLTTGQIAEVQISTDGGGVFSDTVWSRPGTGSPGGGFESVEIDLSDYAGQTVHLRFVLDFHGGSAYTGTSTAVGWFFDSISIGETAARPFYSIGEPTDSEQYNLERINRSRADALAEADRLVALASSGGEPRQCRRGQPNVSGNVEGVSRQCRSNVEGVSPMSNVEGVSPMFHAFVTFSNPRKRRKVKGKVKGSEYQEKK